MDLSFPSLCFYLFSAILVAAGCGVIFARNPVHGVLSLVLAFFTAGMIWLLMQAEFLGIALVLIYVGAVMVLFLFVVMMLDVRVERLREGFWRHLTGGLVVGAIMLAEMTLVLNGRHFQLASVPAPQAPEAGYSNVREVALAIFSDYAYPFELASAVLLVAMIAAVMLTFRRREGGKRLDPAYQVSVRAADRLAINRVDPVRPQAPEAAAEEEAQ